MRGSVSVGSICSGIEAASVAWSPLGMQFEWFSETGEFQSKLLAKRYPCVRNLGDMRFIAKMLSEGAIPAPDLICGGTPCQAFSLAGHQDGLNDDRGNLTLRFVDIVEATDRRRKTEGKNPAFAFWENVEGVLSDKTNAFGCLVCSLAGVDLFSCQWPKAGILRGEKRNVAWRLLDAKFFGLPQQRRRLYLIASGKNFSPEDVLFELHKGVFEKYPSSSLVFEKDGHQFEVFREYSDCLYSAYGTKWNGNAAAYNGSLFVVQDGKLRRLTPLECERLMGFPDGYTDLGATKTVRYRCIGNSWSIPVVRWLGDRLLKVIDGSLPKLSIRPFDSFVNLGDNLFVDGAINCSVQLEVCRFKTMRDIVSSEADKNLFLSPAACLGILRRSMERKIRLNRRLEILLKEMAEGKG